MNPGQPEHHHHHMLHHMHAYYHCGYPFDPEVDDALDKKKRETRGRRGDDADAPLWKFDWERHKERVKSAGPKVDTSPPMVIRNLYTTPARFNRSIANFVRIERENTIMLQRIAQIMKDKPTVLNRLEDRHHSINIRTKGRENILLRIAFDNLELWKRIKNARAEYSRKDLLAQYAIYEKDMGNLSFYPLFWKTPSSHSLYYKLRKEAMLHAKEKPKTNIYLNLESEDAKVGVVVMELRTDICPMTCFNFFMLCTGDLHNLGYKCSEIHRVVPGVLWQGGDVIGKDGRGGRSIYGEVFPDENFKLKHDAPGVVSMANIGPNTNGSQFIITACRLPALDGKNVVFGKVINGLDKLMEMNQNYLSPSGSFKKKVWIAGCGDATSDKDYEKKRAAEKERLLAEAKKLPPPPPPKQKAPNSGYEAGSDDDDDDDFV